MSFMLQADCHELAMLILGQMKATPDYLSSTLQWLDIAAQAGQAARSSVPDRAFVFTSHLEYKWYGCHVFHHEDLL
jgi:hypothetical protein